MCGIPFAPVPFLDSLLFLWRPLCLSFDIDAMVGVYGVFLFDTFRGVILSPRRIHVIDGFPCPIDDRPATRALRLFPLNDLVTSTLRTPLDALSTMPPGGKFYLCRGCERSAVAKDDARDGQARRVLFIFTAIGVGACFLGDGA